VVDISASKLERIVAPQARLIVKLLADVSFADPPFSEDFREVLRINSNAFLVIDSDITPTKRQLREYKQRVHDEIGENRCWITKGKEIENYLRPELKRLGGITS
jgi:hypothetical protein